MNNIFTIGYQQYEISAFTNILLLNKIRLLIDIRENPYSWKTEYSAKNLKLYLGEACIEYLHLKQLGSPRQLRLKLKGDGDYCYFFAQYKIHLQNQKSVLDMLGNLLKEKRLCLMCYEKDVERCHRKLVAEMLASCQPGVGIIHLR